MLTLEKFVRFRSTRLVQLARTMTLAIVTLPIKSSVFIWQQQFEGKKNGAMVIRRVSISRAVVPGASCTAIFDLRTRG